MVHSVYHNKMEPTYGLSKIKSLIRNGHYVITSRAMKDASDDFDMSPVEILEEVMSLTEDDFDKTMPSDKKPGTYQDVYFKTLVIDKQEKLAYIKLNILKRRKEEAIVISFHKSTGKKGKKNVKK